MHIWMITSIASKTWAEKWPAKSLPGTASVVWRFLRGQISLGYHDAE